MSQRLHFRDFVEHVRAFIFILQNATEKGRAIIHFDVRFFVRS